MVARGGKAHRAMPRGEFARSAITRTNSPYSTIERQRSASDESVPRVSTCGWGRRDSGGKHDDPHPTPWLTL
jgi:hypothetical protein